MIAALYVDPRGPYPRLPGVDAWDERRDARKYCGTDPVVAHPPCGAWSGLRHLYRRDDRDCALHAVDAVRCFGGVLEHPARSLLWDAVPLPRPDAAADVFGGFTVEVEQVAWGHVARKRTWLYIVGIPADIVRLGIRKGGTPTHWVSGRRGCRRFGANVPPGIKVCSAQQRRRTPPAFAEWLVSLARQVQR